MAMIALRGVTKYFGATRIFNNVTMQIERGDHVALVGANGAGKTTLLRLINGLDRPDGGEITIARNTRLGYLPQEAQFQSRHTLREAMLSVFSTLRQQARRLAELQARLEEAGTNPADWPAEILEEYTTLLARFEEHGGYTYENRIERILSGLGFDRDSWDRPAMGLSGGQRTRAHLARLLLEEPELLLLDEPTNHLDVATTEWLENFLSAWDGGLLIVSHDRYFLDKVTRRTIELVDGTTESYPAAYSRYVQLRAERYARRNKEYQAQRAQIAKTEEFIRRYGAGQRAKEARGRQTRLNRLERLNAAPQSDALSLQLDVSSATGETILDTVRLRIGFPNHQLLHVPNMRVERGSKVAIIGPNGSGKSTLLRTLVGEQKPLAGTYQWGHNVQVGYYAQAHEGLERGNTLIAEIQNACPMSEEEARSVLARFLFTGDDVYKQVDDLSGGERSRVALAKLTLQDANVLLLDEPTNHLDIPARQALEGMLKAYPGSLLFVSHDRYFINAIANAIWSVEDGIIRLYRGTYSDYLTAREQGRFIPELPDPDNGAARTGTGRPQRPKKIRDNASTSLNLLPNLNGVDERLVPVLQTLDELENRRTTVQTQIANAASLELERLVALSTEYQELQQELLKTDVTFLSTLHAMLHSS